MNPRFENHLCEREHCFTPTQNYLCDNCTEQLATMLDQLPWLLTELDARIQRLDRIAIGTIGRNRRPDEMNVMDFDAADTARKVRKTLLNWVEQISLWHSGRAAPALDTVATAALAKWLERNVAAIALLPMAGQLYRDVERLVGADTDRRGQLVTAINRQERHFAGPCPHVRAHSPDGEAVECGAALYADGGETTVTCPACGHTVDVDKNRMKAYTERDLLPVARLLEVLDDLGEHVPRVTFYRWVREGRIRRKGWFHNGQIMDFRIRRTDPGVYSLRKARKLRTREQALKEAAG